MVDVLPDKIVAKILSFIPRRDVQTKRTVCSQWKRTIESEFGVMIVVKNGNYKAMLRSEVATSAKFQNFTVAFTEAIAFSGSLTTAEFSGEIGRSNIVKLLKACSKIEYLQFTNIFFADAYSRINFDDITIHLTHLKFVVNYFQDRLFTAELIIVDLLTRIHNSSLCTIAILSEDPLSTMRHRLLPSQRDFDEVIFTGVEEEPEESVFSDQQIQGPQQAEWNRIAMDIAVIPPNHDNHPENQQVENEDEIQEGITTPNLIRLRGLDFNFFAVGMNMWDEGTIFPMPIQGGNISLGETPFTVSSDIFTELMFQNRASLKNLSANFCELKCLGDISHWDENRLREIQLENCCYSFGGTRDDDGEYLLLRNQHSLKSLEIVIVREDVDSGIFWEDVRQAVTASCATLNTIDMSIFTDEEWILNLDIFSTCDHLKTLTFNHYSRKTGIEVLPVSLEYLKINGTLNLTQLYSIANRLKNLKVFEFHLNMEGDTLDLVFFKNILSLPKLQKITLFECTIEEAEMDFLRNTPGIDIREDYPVSSENCLLIIKINSNFDRNSLLQ